ncbi:MAG: cytochrome c [Gammaproteobacteria bacterium]
MSQRNLFLFLALLSLGSVMAAAQADGQAKTAVCVACHGADGNSMNPIWPNLAGQHEEYIVAQLKAFKSGARANPSMSPMAATVADEDMATIGAWYRSQTLKIAPLGEVDVSKGEALYRGGDAERGIPACMACHGPTGAGNGAARFPALSGQHAEYTALQLKAYRDGSRSTDPQEMMRTIAKRLGDDDIEQLSRYISALH